MLYYYKTIIVFSVHLSLSIKFICYKDRRLSWLLGRESACSKERSEQKITLVRKPNLYLGGSFPSSMKVLNQEGTVQGFGD